MICKKCSKVIPDDVPFCPVCGAAAHGDHTSVVTMRGEGICPKCKNDIYSGAKECPICGEKVTLEFEKQAMDLKKEYPEGFVAKPLSKGSLPDGSGWAGFLRGFVWFEIILGLICCIALGSVIGFWAAVVGVLVVLLSAATIMVLLGMADDLRKARHYLSEIHVKMQ